MSELSLSPSQVHRRVTNELTPTLAYDGGAVSAWQDRLRPKVRELLGLDVMPSDPPPLNPRTLWRREHELGTIEKIVFTAEEGADVPAYFCLPKNPLSDPPPVFVCLQGHSTGMHLSIGVTKEDETKPMQPEGDRDFTLGCLRRGVAALAIEQRAFGEREERFIPHLRPGERCHNATMHALMLGRTLVGQRVFDAQRAIDYLQTRPEVDHAKIGIMGNSGGGTVTTYAAAVDPRLAFAMPSCAFCTFRDSIMSIPHCGDNYLPRILRYAEMADVLGLFAPRPVVVVTGREDEIFPLAGVEEAFADLKAIYKAAGAEAACQLVIGEGGHRFYADPGWAAMVPIVQNPSIDTMTAS